MRLLFDALGGDNAPVEIVKGAVLAAEEMNVDISFVGNKIEIEKVLKELNYDKEVSIINTTEKIENEEEPAYAIRKKKNSSTALGLKALKENNADAFISAGSTGALLAGGLFITKRIDNVKRAALPTELPSLSGKTLVIDSGANMDCDANLLLQFALMGKTYLESVKGLENPRVGLLNVGTEEGKGNALTKEAFTLLKNSNLNFVGNIEARDVTMGKCDLVVCDGFVGNILLKNTEGVAKFLMHTIQSEIKNADLSKETLLEVGTLFSKMSKKLDYKEVGGTILLGLKQVVVKAHGDSDSIAIKNAASAAVKALNNNIIETLERDFKENI